MRITEAVRQNKLAYAVLLCLFCLITAFQVRIGLDTIGVERSSSFYIPFVLDPFSNRIRDYHHSLSWELGDRFQVRRSGMHRGDEVLEVNGRPFRGMAVYIEELRKSFDPETSGTMTATLRTGPSRIHTVEIGFPHCTCGIPTRFEAAALWLIPQLFCIFIAFLVAALRPRSLLARTFLALMLSLTQLQYWNDWDFGFQLTATPMLWTDWTRIPAVAYHAVVQHSWPAALLLFAVALVNLPRSLAIATAAAGFLAFAGLEALLDVAWSEDFRRGISLYNLVESHGTELLLMSFASVAVIAWRLIRGVGLALAVLGLMAASLLFASPAGITKGTLPYTVDPASRFDLTVPAFHQTHAFVALLFTTAAILATLIAARRHITRIEAASLALLAPLLIDMAGAFGAYWYPLGPRFEGLWLLEQNWLWIVLSTAALGLSGIAHSVLRRIAKA